MWSLIFRNLFFTVLQPGVVAGLLPYLLLGNRFAETFQKSLRPFQFVAVLLFSVGAIILFYCIGLFAVKGKGTLSPADPTKKLVVAGLYRYSRNPMYLGVLLILAGESIFFQSLPILLYALLVFCGFYVFIVRVEEPRLRKEFKETYRAYAGRVRRWL